MYRTCPEHPEILRRMARIEAMLYVVIGVALGSGALHYGRCSRDRSPREVRIP